MAACELCGENSSVLSLTRIAGTTMKVCDKCKNMGKNLEPGKNPEFTFRHRVKEEDVVFEVVSDYSLKINQGMQKKSLNIHQLARAVNIRESTLTKYTTNKIKPDIESAHKIERFLEIKLTEEFKNDNSTNNFEIEDAPVKTLGDMLQNLQKQTKNKK